MIETVFRCSTFKHCRVKAAGIKDTSFRQATIKDTDLREANVVSLDLSGANLEKAFGTFLEYLVNRIQSEGAVEPWSAQEIMQTVSFFSRATCDEHTLVSQAVRDAILLMRNEANSPPTTFTSDSSQRPNGQT